jgi:hypothetical protein
MFFSEYHFGKPPCVIGRRVKKKERAEEGESRRRREQKKERAEEGESRRRREQKKERAEDGGFISTLTPQESGKHHVAGPQGF